MGSERRMKRNAFTFMFLLLTVCGTSFAASAESDRVVKHGIVIFEEDRFAGWPANNGIWNWGDEIVVGFTLGYYKDKGGGHPIDGDRPSGPMQARSLDGGETWSVETPTFMIGEGKERAVSKLDKARDFTHPDFAARFRNGNFYFSDDRCKTWDGPFALPSFGRPGLLARTDYIVNGKHDMLVFMATEKDNGGEGWPAAIRTRDGGLTWTIEGWIGEQPPVDKYGYSIMPSTVKLSNGALFSMIRRGGLVDDEKQWWMEPFLSPDQGKTWYMLDEPWINNAGNPAAMIMLDDGRIALTYGFRTPPYGIRARISDDNAVTWSKEFILRGDGGGWDVGYPRTVQRADGKCVTTYYFNDNERKERYIAYTIWQP